MSNLKNLLNYLFEYRADLINATKEIDSDDRVTVISSNSSGRIGVNLTKRYSQPSSNKNKPNGLWYSFGTGWIDYITDPEAGMSKFIGHKNVVYKIHIESANIKSINDKNELKDFHNKYYDQNLQTINWETVANKFDGFEIQIDPDSVKNIYRWLSGWDIASGCVWNLNKINLEAVNKVRNEEEQLEKQVHDWLWGEWVWGEINWETGRTNIKNIIQSELGQKHIEFLKQYIPDEIDLELDAVAGAHDDSQKFKDDFKIEIIKKLPDIINNNI